MTGWMGPLHPHQPHCYTLFKCHVTYHSQQHCEAGVSSPSFCKCGNGAGGGLNCLIKVPEQEVAGLGFPPGCLAPGTALQPLGHDGSAGGVGGGWAPASGGQTQSSPRGRPPAAGAAVPRAEPAGLTPSRVRPWLPSFAGFPFRPVPRLVRPRDEGRQLSSWAGRGLCKLHGIRGADGRGGSQGVGSLDRHLHFTVPRAEPRACCPLPPWPPRDPALLVSSRPAPHNCCFRETLQVLPGHLVSAHSKG